MLNERSKAILGNSTQNKIWGKIFPNNAALRCEDPFTFIEIQLE